VLPMPRQAPGRFLSECFLPIHHVAQNGGSKISFGLDLYLEE